MCSAFATKMTHQKSSCVCGKENSSCGGGCKWGADEISEGGPGALLGLGACCDTSLPDGVMD
jgi:hypothetical protein